MAEECFVELALDRKAHVKFRNPNELYDYVISKTQEMSKRYYVFIDEIQLSVKIKNEGIDEHLVPEEDKDMLYTTFYDILNDLMARPSNSWRSSTVRIQPPHGLSYDSRTRAS